MLTTPEELHDILESWELDTKNFEELRSSWHNIFKVRRKGQMGYLRITPDCRHPDEIRAELDWMQSLNEHQYPVAKILRSRAGHDLQTLQLKSGRVSICCFEQAPGRVTEKRLDFREAVIKNWATLLSQLHEHARSFTPPNKQARRKNWDEDSVLLVALKEASDSLEAEATVFLRLVEHFKKSATQTPLTLTHADLHFGNMTITENEKLTAFDFDDACYHFPEHDVAVALVSIRKAAWEQKGLFDTQKLEAVFLENYFGTVKDLRLWCAYRIGLSFFWALGSAKQGVFDEERLLWLKNSTPWWKSQFRELTESF